MLTEAEISDLKGDLQAAEFRERKLKENQEKAETKIELCSSSIFSLFIPLDLCFVENLLICD